MPQLAVDGAELTYDDEGPRDAGTAPLVFLHGWTADRHRWDHQMAHFAPHRRVIRLDLRGHGESSGTGARTIEDLARDVTALLDHLGVGRFVPVGHSMGGMTAQTLALAHPGRAGEIRVPTLMVHGYHDIQLPVRQMLRLAKDYEDAEIRVLDAGHELPVEKPAELTAVLDRFLDRPPARA
ncbi:alpha/beta fold hydrolase [Streptomyces fungicidicus]|uniref:alpha/beta fold hydrolase n=1 Tax=Streptomyces fungicidicus TaxID=68203 RepID=UPI003D759AA7